MKWWPWRRPPNPGVEAQAQLERLASRDEQVAALGVELRETQRRNNFSGMVAAALTRGAHEGR